VLGLPPIELRAALKALAGFFLGLAIWVALSPLYTRAIARGAELVIRAFERPPVTRLRPMEDDRYVSIDRSDFDPRSKRPGVPLRDLTFNFILLTALFAIHPRALSDRNFIGFVLASLVLALTHVLGAVAEVMALYVMKLGAWSLVHYSDVERNIWTVASHAYRVVLMYAFAFALWWAFRPGSQAPPPKAVSRRKR
jgi:hypothetical protein